VTPKPQVIENGPATGDTAFTKKQKSVSWWSDGVNCSMALGLSFDTIDSAYTWSK